MQTDRTKKLQDNRRLLLISIAVNIVILVTLVLVFYPAFETNDDSGLIAIVGGSRGVRDPHMVHVNYLMGLMFAGLFKAAPSVQWTAVVQYLVLFISFVTLTYCFFRKFEKPGMRVLITAVIAWFSYEGYIRLQYSKTAGILVAIGLAVIFCELLSDEASRPLVTAGFVITIIGSFYRMLQFDCEVAMFAAMVLYLLLVNREKGDGRKGRTAKALVIGAALLIAAFGLRAFDRAQYTDPEWTAYLEFDKYRTEVIDYGVPDFDDNEEAYAKIGIDRTAYDLLKNWTFEDSEKFTAETFEKIAALKPHKEINLSLIKGYCRGMAKGLLHEGTFLCFFVIAAGWVFFGRRRRQEVISIITLAVIILALYFYLYYAGRFMVHRVDVGVWLAASLMVLLMYDEEKCDRARLVPAALLIVLFAVSVPWQSHLATGRAAAEKKAAAERDVIEEINADHDHVYLTKPGVVSMSSAYGVFDAVPFGIADNIYPLGGWGAETPVFKSVLERYGIGNPMRDMIDNDRVYLVDDRIDTTVAYLQRWYDPEARAEKVKEAGGRDIYRIVTK